MKLQIPKPKISALSIPLSLARESIVDSAPICTILRETTQRIEFLMKADDGTEFPSRIEHRLSDEGVLVGMQSQQKFCPSQRFLVFSRRIDRCLRKVLECGEYTLRGHVVPAYDKHVAVLQYVIPLQYSSLSDQEYVDNLGVAVSQCSKAMTLIYSVIGDIRTVRRLPSDKECMESIYRGYACFVPAVSVEQASGWPN